MSKPHHKQTDGLAHDGINTLRDQGFLFLPKWGTDQELLRVAQSIGTVIRIPAFLPHSDIPTVQSLRPHQKNIAPKNQYSAAFGLSAFPLHTDLAHWIKPPRYALIRCITGFKCVVTRLLHYRDAVQAIGADTFRHALFRPRRPPHSQILSLLPMKLRSESDDGMRWDPIFIKPMNESADRVTDAMRDKRWQEECVRSVSLAHFGDTLLIDNWRCLHGRDEVPTVAVHRRLERIYLSEVRT